MNRYEFLNAFGKRPVIPAVRNETDFIKALGSSSPFIITLFGDIFSIHRLANQSRQAGKVMLLHVDLIEGIGKDKSGIKYLAQIGIKAIISTKPHLIKTARDEGVFGIQRLFLMDSEAVRTGIGLLQSVKPDALEVLPGWIPRHVIEQLTKVCSIPIMAGGLIATPQDVQRALASGVCAVSTTKVDLWEYGIGQQLAAEK